MTRDVALAQASYHASTQQSVAIVWHYPEQPMQWLWADYYAGTDLLDAIDVRYVLPHGQVTKLS